MNGEGGGAVGVGTERAGEPWLRGLRAAAGEQTALLLELAVEPQPSSCKNCRAFVQMSCADAKHSAAAAQLAA